MATRPRPCYGSYNLTTYQFRAATIPEQRAGRSIRTSCLLSARRAKCRAAPWHIPQRVQRVNISL